MWFGVEEEVPKVGTCPAPPVDSWEEAAPYRTTGSSGNRWPGGNNRAKAQELKGQAGRDQVRWILQSLLMMMDSREKQKKVENQQMGFLAKDTNHHVFFKKELSLFF